MSKKIKHNIIITAIALGSIVPADFVLRRLDSLIYKETEERMSLNTQSREDQIKEKIGSLQAPMSDIAEYVASLSFWEVKDGEFNNVRSRFNSLKHRSRVPEARLFVYDSEEMEAFSAIGKDSTHQLVVLSSALLKILSPSEADAFIGHELGHLAHNHILLKRQAYARGAELDEINALALSLESQADEHSVRLTCNPEAMANGLEKALYLDVVQFSKEYFLASPVWGKIALINRPFHFINKMRENMEENLELSAKEHSDFRSRVQGLRDQAKHLPEPCRAP